MIRTDLVFQGMLSSIMKNGKEIRSEEFKADDFSLSLEYKYLSNPKIEMVV